MRHRKTTLRLNEKPRHAKMVERNLVTSLILYETIRTTKKRARVIQPILDRLVTIAKTRTPHVAIRAINRVITDKNASRKIMEVFLTRYTARNSGFTRMTPVGSRKGDGADLVDLALMDMDSTVTTGEKKSAKAAAKKKVSSAS